MVWLLIKSQHPQFLWSLCRNSFPHIGMTEQENDTGSVTVDYIFCINKTLCSEDIITLRTMHTLQSTNRLCCQVHFCLFEECQPVSESRSLSERYYRRWWEDFNQDGVILNNRPISFNDWFSILNVVRKL